MKTINFPGIKSRFNSIRNGEKNIEEITESLLKNKSISLEEREKFLSTSFWEVMKTAGNIFGMEYKDKHFETCVPYIMTRIVEKAPNFFDNIRTPTEYVRANIFRYEHPKADITFEKMSSEDKRKFINTKKEFNRTIDKPLRHAVWFGQITKDYDIIGDAKTIEDPELRKIHLEMRDSRLQAFKDAINKNNAEINVFMRVIDDDGVTQHATYTASKLLEIGINVYNYERGEKFGAFKTGKSIPYCGEKLKKIRDQFRISIKDISKDTGLNKKTLEKYEDGELEVSYKDANVLENFFFKQAGEKPKLVRENHYVFTISRRFPAGKPDKQFIPTEPQFHQEFTGVFIEDWTQAYNGIFNSIERKKLDYPRIEKNELKPFGYFN